MKHITYKALCTNDNHNILYERKKYEIFWMMTEKKKKNMTQLLHTFIEDILYKWRPKKKK